MASIFGHVIASTGISGTLRQNKSATGRLILLSGICSILPDADVIGFQIGISYDSFWGHRGFTHSIIFAFLLAGLLTYFLEKWCRTSKSRLFLILFLSTLSHTLLDMLTNGGLGTAIFSPFDNRRYFFPWRPIQVSPLGVGNFLSRKGIDVLKSELCWIFLPILIVCLIVKVTQKKSQNK